jgi:hypothetical protein
LGILAQIQSLPSTQDPSTCRFETKSRPLRMALRPAELAWGLIVRTRQCARAATRRGSMAGQRELSEARKTAMGD